MVHLYSVGSIGQLSKEENKTYKTQTMGTSQKVDHTSPQTILIYTHIISTNTRRKHKYTHVPSTSRGKEYKQTEIASRTKTQHRLIII